MGTRLKPTQLRDLYAALGALKEQEQTALAELHAEEPERLIARFAHSVDTVAGYPANTEAFHDRAKTTGLRQPLDDPPTPLNDGVKTVDVARHLADARECCVENAPELDFRFVDREIFALRTTKSDTDRPRRRFMDLLLVSRDGLPIVGELKIGTDKPTYFALVQALMYAAEISSSSQRARLLEHYPKAAFTSSEREPLLDIYLIALEPPRSGKYRERSFKATEVISSKLVKDPRIQLVIRRIAYIEARTTDQSLSFVKRFAFESAPA
jgi:hypothetical protein